MDQVFFVLSLSTVSISLNNMISGFYNQKSGKMLVAGLLNLSATQTEVFLQPETLFFLFIWPSLLELLN